MSTIHSTTYRQQRTSGMGAPTPQRFIRAAPTAGLLSETRAPGAVLLGVGAFVVCAGVRRRHLHAAAVMATLTFLGYGLARTASMVVDGSPSGSIVAATVVELVLGASSLVAAIASTGGALVGRSG